MHEDSMHFSTSGHRTQNQAVTQEPTVESFECNDCTLLFKSKVCLLEHLNKSHGLDADVAHAGLKNPETSKVSTDNNSSSSGSNFEEQHCDFKADVQDVFNEHEKHCQNKSENENMVGNLSGSENPETKIHSTNQHKEAAATTEMSSDSSVVPTSKTKCMLNSSKDLKTYKRPTMQTITNYFAMSSGSNGKPPVKLADSPVLLDSTKETLILKESPSNSSGVFKVTAKPTIDISKQASCRFLLNDHLQITDLKSPKPEEQFRETFLNNVGKRTNNEHSKSPPAKIAKTDKQKAHTQKQQLSSNTGFSFELSEDEEEKKVRLGIRDMEVYFCKHCDYNDVSIKCVSTHYQNNHPYVRYNTAYIEDRSDRSATFRCLECPVEFFSVADLKRHYMENHPEAPNVFTMQSRESSLVFKCFVCLFTTSALKVLKEHYKEEHPTHKVDNSLMFCKYSANRCQEGPLQLNTCETAISPQKPQGVLHEGAHTPCKEVKSEPSPQHPISKGADVALYHCNNCKFSHKSVVVMHVHYQRSHPDEEVTIDRIKQSADVTSHAGLLKTPEKCPNSVGIIEKLTAQKNTSDSSKEARNNAEIAWQKKISLSLINPKHAPEASQTQSESAQTKKVKSAEGTSRGKGLPSKHCREESAGIDSLSLRSPDALFYCRFCSFSSANMRSIVGHHNAKHAALASTVTGDILSYSAEVWKKKLQSETEASAGTTSSDSERSKQVEVCTEKERQHEEDKATGASVMEFNPYACAEDLFYCQKCNYGNMSVKGVLNHQAKVHQTVSFSRQSILEYTTLICAEIEKSKSQAKELPFLTDLPLPLMNEGDDNMFFCHFCNFRHRTVEQVLRHYFRRHHGFVAKREQIHLYTSMVLKQTQTSLQRASASQEVSHASLGEKRDKKTKLDKVSASPSVTALQTKRTLQCHRCSYSTQYLHHLKRHICKIHKSRCTLMDVLRLCFEHGTLQSGYHCELCVFSHKNAAAVYEHYQEKHPGHKISHKYVSTQLYVGPETSIPTIKKPQMQHTVGIGDGDDTNGSLLSQRTGQNETKTYSCRACSFKGSSVSRITDHYRAVHPWSVKEDGSVLDIISRKKLSANKQVEEHNETLVSSDTYLTALELHHLPGSSEEAGSSANVKCPHCPARFPTQRGLNTHCGMKHREAETENLDEHQEEQVQIQTRVHVFKCPHCTYVNTNYQGVLTHCQMRHPALLSRADSLYVDETHLYNWEECLKRKGPDLKLCGYKCETCPQIFATQEKLNKHCEKGHNETVEETVPAPQPSAVSKRKQYKTHSKPGSVSKASFLSKKIYAAIRCQYCTYSCSTKLALDRHLRVRHNNETVSKAQGCLYKCALCSSFFLKKRRLASHYAKKHGKEAFLKYCAPLFIQVPKKPVPALPDRPLTEQPENTSEAYQSSAIAEENKILVYKCPVCPYVNASHHGTLTHCQMKHPDLTARADDLQTDEILVTNMVSCTVGKGSNERGYMCKKCPQIHVSLKKLRIHCQREHGQATASEHSLEMETEKQREHSSQGSVLEAVTSKNETSPVSTTEIGLSQQLGTAESNTSVQSKESQYRCNLCSYMGSCRKYLYCHYKKTHKLDPLTTCKLLEKYSRHKHNKPRNLPEADSEGCASVECKMCPDLKFDSSQLLIAHYRTFHRSDGILDFIVLSKASKKTTGLYKCTLCNKQMNGIRKLCHHLDHHRVRAKMMAEAAKRKASLVITTTPEAKSMEICREDELPVAEAEEAQAQWNVTPVQTFTSPPRPLPSPSKPTDLELPELESRQDKHSCKQCQRRFISLKGLRLHERSHAALAAIKNKLRRLSTSALKHNINKYVLYKEGTMRPFLCSYCSYRTTVMGLWKTHFLKAHQDVVMHAAGTDNQNEESAHWAGMEPPSSSEELNRLPELKEPEITQKSLYLEHPDVQRQLNHFSLVAQAAAPSKATVQETKLLHCDVCNFSTEHLSSMRRHYINRHGKKILRCKDCSFFTGSRKTLEMHMKKGHSASQSEPTHQKDLRCPFCLYQTKNKNNMIDHIVLHREERVVPIEVRRPKLSRYLQGIVFRCHKCTFTSGSAENLRLHMMRHDDIKPYRCRLCYFDCALLSDLEAHLSDKHQVVRNHELVGQVSLDQLEARVGRMPEEDEESLSNLEHHESEDVKTEDFDTDCNEAPHETQAKNLTEIKIMEIVTLQTEGAHQKQEQDDKNGDEESATKSSVLDPQCENMNTAVQEKHELDPQERAEVSLLPDIEGGQKIADTAGQEVGEGNNADIQYDDCVCLEKETNENQAQPKLRDSEDSSVTVTQQKEEAAGGSSATHGKLAEKAQAHKRHIKALKHRTLNIEARVEDDILRHILLLDEDGSIRKRDKKAAQERTIKTEQNSEPEVNVLSENLLLGEEGGITLALSQKNHTHTETVSAFARKSCGQANGIRAQERLPVERHLLTLTPNCGQLKINHKEILGVSFRSCKEENLTSSEEVRDPYGEMPVLENEYLREEMGPLGSSKEEDQNDPLEQKQDKEDELISDDEKRSSNQGHREGDGTMEADSPHGPKGALTIPDGAAGVLIPAATEEKVFTCDFCGRNLTNSSELERHIMRHGK
ncbi:zinc finger protein 462-like [Chaetodon trifascialis]|uniref:zinc finger protein 462-like n=1 Tax=Chaetodon trifascialis TaxID=109706 RepID=UPI0039917CAD